MLDCTPSLDKCSHLLVSVSCRYEAVPICHSKLIFGEIKDGYWLSDGSSSLPWASLNVNEV